MDSAVLDLPAPAAARLSRPGWRDPRLLVGIAMVAASVLLGSWVVRSAQHTTPVLVARTTIVPGDRIEADDLVTADVQLAPGELSHYLRAAPAAGAVAVAVVREGELVPAAAVGAAQDVDVRSVAVPLARQTSNQVVVGAQVDVWFTPGSNGGTPATPHQIAGPVVVAEIGSDGHGLGSTGGRTVHLLVPTDHLAAVLAALASDGDVDVVAVPGSGRR
ncbi:hypothetical protein [Cellulomonas sp. HZM]|uniref:hypothetical protein n=1 Tax=Cellulomonas sp. HZM TaxID=1454010 RepID=UPI000493959A|nr:hypothetical protein [Cellulomonas sp. HZM]